MKTKQSPISFVESGQHLPSFIRDFHNQKDLFKLIHTTYSEGNDQAKLMPDWIQAHCYTIDWFLWFMGQRGYTLQKNRSNVDFKPLILK
jgi:hypothetical protein